MTTEYEDVIEHCKNLFEDVRHVPMTNEAYHGNSWKSLSKTRLTVFMNDPQEFYQRWITGEMEDHDTDALIFGRIFHEMVLEKVGSVTDQTWKHGTLAVFRQCPAPRRAADIVQPGEELWVVTMPEPGIVRKSSEWGDQDDRSWMLAPSVTGQVTAYCAFADMHEDGKLFTHIPDAVLSDGCKRGKTYTNWADKNPGTKYSAKDWYKHLSMRRRLRQHGDANQCLFQGGVPEYTLVGKCIETGLEVRTRLDFYKPVDQGTLITDLKTTRDASPKAWNRQADKDGLNMQAAIVLGMSAHVFGNEIAFRFVTCDKRAPFMPMSFEIEPQFLELGAEDYRKTAIEFQQCIDSGRWLSSNFGNPEMLTTPPAKQVQWR